MKYLSVFEFDFIWVRQQSWVRVYQRMAFNRYASRSDCGRPIQQVCVTLKQFLNKNRIFPKMHLFYRNVC